MKIFAVVDGFVGMLVPEEIHSPAKCGVLDGFCTSYSSIAQISRIYRLGYSQSKPWPKKSRSDDPEIQTPERPEWVIMSTQLL